MQVYSMKEAGLAPDIEENGTTFEENAGTSLSRLSRSALFSEKGVSSPRYLAEYTPGSPFR